MKQSLCFLFILFALSASGATRGANDLFELRTVIDSAKAVSAINAEIAQRNAPFERDIARLLDQMDRNAVAHRLASDTLASVKRLQQLYLPKVKEKELAGEFAAYYEAELNKLPLDKLFTLAKEKDVEKAHRKQNVDEEIEKLVLKIKTRQVKEASKGNLEKTIVSELIDSACRHLDFLTEILDASLKAESDSVAGLRGQLTPLRDAFDLSDYTARFDPETIPLKQINVSLANAPADYHSFAYYAAKYPYCLKESAEGKFNGIIADKIYVFPCESAVEPYGESFNADCFIARKLVLKSEKGSVPECIAEAPGEESLSVVFRGSGEWIGSGVNCIQTLRDVWEKGGKERDGVFVSTHPDESTSSEDLTYVLDSNGWQNRPPLNPEYLSFDECLRLLPEQVVSQDRLSYNWNDEDLGRAHCELIAVKSNDGKDIYIKSKPTNADLIVKAEGLRGWEVKSDMFGDRNDGLMMAFENPYEWDGEMGLVYNLSWDGPSATVLNGKYTDQGEIWNKKRIYCFTKNSDGAYPITLDYGTTLFNEKLNTKFTKYTYKLYTSSVAVEWPDSGQEPLVKTIRKWIAAGLGLDKRATDTNPYRLLHDALKDCSENPEFGNDCQEIIANCAIIFSNEKVVTMTCGVSSYFGGARPSYTEQSATFATDSGERLTMKMLPSAATLRPYVIDGLKRELQLTEKELREVLWLDNFERSIMDSYPIVTEDGLTFCFDVGAIGPNMAGVIKSVIPTDVAKSLVSGYPAAKFF